MREVGSRHLEQVDGLRAIAVLAVVGYHTLSDSWPAGHAPLWVACGARGVDLFFAISGFCLAYPFLRAFRGRAERGVDYGAFFGRRISRIGPVYWVALAIFGLLGLTRFGFPAAPGVHASFETLREFVCDALFLTSAAPTFNASFWTLGIEMRWYLLFPVLIGLYVRSRFAFGVVAVACSLAYAYAPASISDEGTLPGFMLGIVAADLFVMRSRLRRFAPAIALVTLGLAWALQARSARIDHGNPIWQLAATFLVLSGVGDGFGRILRLKPLRFVGIASYSIYLVHGPVLQGLDRAGVPPAASAILALGAGIVFYLTVERPLSSPAVRSGLEGAMRRFADQFKRKRGRPPVSVARAVGIAKSV